MKKAWNGKVRRVHVIDKSSGEERSSFLADDVRYSNGVNTFYLDGKEINFYRDTQCYHRSEELKEEFKMSLRELLSNIDFDYGVDESGKVYLIDLQGANYGNIQGDRFTNVADIIDRCDMYWNDYFKNDCEEQLEKEFDTFQSLLNYLDTHETIISQYERDAIDCIINPEKVKFDDKERGDINEK